MWRHQFFIALVALVESGHIREDRSGSIEVSKVRLPRPNLGSRLRRTLCKVLSLS